MHLAIFDFDGTVTTRDSFLDFIRFAVGGPRFIGGFLCLAPMLVLYKTGVIPNYRAKEMVIEHFFKGWEVDRCRRVAQEYSTKQLPAIIRPKALDKIQWHRRQGHRIVIATASIDHYLKYWCAQHHLDLLATRLEEKEGRLTGKLFGKNCHGPEKVVRIKAVYDLKLFKKIYAYGDSEADKVLKEIAGEFHYKPFL